MAGINPTMIVLCWRSNRHDWNDITDIEADIVSAGYTISHRFAASRPEAVQDEARRLIRDHVGPTPLIATGPDSDYIRVDVKVAPGSFAAAESRGLDVLVELSPREPVKIVESERPIPAKAKSAG